jgi:hypothetical protein
MDNDFILVLGIIIGVLTIPAIFSAMVDSKVPRIPTFAAVVSGAMILYAISNQPSGYAIGDLPEVFSRVFGPMFR